MERDGELRQLRDALSRARRGRGSLVLLSGDPGIGKTSLIGAFTEEAGETARVLVGACDDLLTPRTLGPFRDMFRDAGLPPPQPGDRPERDGYIDALLAEMAFTQRPAVVIVDDAHWADDASLDVIRYLGRRIDRLSALLVVTYRTGDLDDHHPLRTVLGALTTPATLRIALGGLSEAAVARMASDAGADPAEVVAAVGGNPFYLTEALASPGSAVPATVRDAVIARVRGLPERTQRALEVLSVVPHEAEAALMDATLGTSSAVFEAAERVGMVTASGGRIRFRHVLARRAVEATLVDSRRIALNRRVLAALELDEAEPSRLVHHAAAAADRAALVRYAPAAASEAAAGEAHHETVAFARLALEQGSRLGEETATRMHGLAAYALYALNHFGEAAAHARAAVRRWQALGTSPVDLGRALLRSGRMQTMLGHPAEARADIRLALRTLEPLGPNPELAHAYGMMGNLDAIEAECASAAEWCARAIDAAGRLGRRDVEAHARIYLGLARVGLGDLGGFDDIHRAIALAREVDHSEYLCRAATVVAAAMIWLGRHPETLPYLDIAESAARDHGFDYQLYHVLALRGHVDLYMGRWDAAERRLREQVGTSRDPAAVMTIPLAVLGRILARRGEPDAATLVARAWEAGCRSQQAHRIAVAGSAVVEEAWLRGDAAAVRATADTLVPLAARARLVYLHGETLRYLARVGERVEPFDGCPAGFAYGIRGDWAAAAAAWAEAGNPYEEALELTEAPDPAVAFDGLRRLDDLGAAATAGLVRRRLRRRGVASVPRGPQRATRQSPAGLTARQRAVLALLADGLTSAEIAERMYVSRRTVDNHVNGVLARLGVSSRRKAVAIAAERGWLETRAPSGAPI